MVIKTNLGLDVFYTLIAGFVLIFLILSAVMANAMGGLVSRLRLMTNSMLVAAFTYQVYWIVITFLDMYSEIDVPDYWMRHFATGLAVVANMEVMVRDTNGEIIL